MCVLWGAIEAVYYDICVHNPSHQPRRGFVFHRNHTPSSRQTRAPTPPETYTDMTRIVCSVWRKVMWKSCKRIYASVCCRCRCLTNTAPHHDDTQILEHGNIICNRVCAELRITASLSQSVSDRECAGRTQLSCTESVPNLQICRPNAIIWK